MRANAIYLLLYASGIYGLVLWPPVRGFVTIIAEPLRRGIAPALVHLPLSVRCVVALIVFDALAYWVHRAAHAWPLLWRVHRVHHSDPDFGPMTTFRFHVLEIAWRMAVQLLPLYILGIAASIPSSVWAVLLAFNVFAHSNLGWTFGPLRGAIVSPAFHAQHHRSETAMHFGMFFAVWDIWFGTAQRSSPASHTPSITRSPAAFSIHESITRRCFARSTERTTKCAVTVSPA
jgi:sterol desaturase/sphingolipid hydroxylase (fatty acid hydroxylase superfamily)